MKPKYIPRDISWLSFNERVFQEATDKTVPLIERMKFLGIFSSNLDEFFRVRVATLSRLAEVKKGVSEFTGENPAKLLKQIHKKVLEQQQRVENVYHAIVEELATHKVYIVDEKHLNKEQSAFVSKYFHENVLPTLAPVMIETAPNFPYLTDKFIYFAIKLYRKGEVKKGMKYALIQIPTDVLPRFVVLPRQGESRSIILLDNVIRFCLNELFAVLELDNAEAYTIKLTRDAELDIDQDLSKSIVEKIEKSVKDRKKGDPVRLVYDREMPKDLLDFIIKKINQKRSLNIIPGGRYHNFRDFINFPNVGNKELLYQHPAPLPHPELSKAKSLFSVIKKKDILVCYPYQSFNHIIDLLREASIDPKVTSIKMTLYRLAKKSSIAYILGNALKNGKSVTVVVELQARFDEEANIFWAKQLKEEGAEVVYGISGLKVHSKLLHITRQEANGPVAYGHIGTGNFNEDTAKLYSDCTLLTTDKRITTEIAKVFHFYSNNFKIGSYDHLLVSPFFMRKRFVKFINKEIKNAEAGKEAYITLKLNSVVDTEMIKKLYQASQAGVKIKLIVRSNCSLIPGIKGMSENIEAISIVDKYLEHSRILIFCNGGDERIYLTSADWMYRNLDLRNEIAVPIYDKKIREKLKKLIDIQLHDNTKARILDEKLDNKYRVALPGEKRVRAQDDIYAYFKGRLQAHHSK